MKKNSFILSVFIAFLFSIMPCLASTNIISSVIISQSKERPNGYELNIDSTNTAQYKTYRDGENSIYFDLKNSTLAENAGTVYDDAQNVESVTVREMDKNKVRIYIKGQHAKNTELVFLNSILESKNTTEPKTVVINRPRDEYKSTNYNDLENQEDIQEWDDNSFNFSHLLTTVLTGLKEGPGGIVLIILTIFALCAIILKCLTKKLSQDNEPLIGLNQNYNKAPVAPQMSDVESRKEQAIRQAQIELAKAHQKYQNYLQNKYQAKPRAFDNRNINADAVKKSIAINQYQKSNQNPYLDQEVIKFNEIPYTFEQNKQKETFAIPKKPKVQPQQVQTKKFTSPYIQRPNANLEIKQKKTLAPSANSRFIESVSKIYEQSGRGDLAQELKNSLSKVKQTTF